MKMELPIPTPSQRTSEELLLLAEEMDALASTAITGSVKQTLETLALRYRALAAERRVTGTGII
jgi:hypothetical protein